MTRKQVTEACLGSSSPVSFPLLPGCQEATASSVTCSWLLPSASPQAQWSQRNAYMFVCFSVLSFSKQLTNLDFPS